MPTKAVKKKATEEDSRLDLSITSDTSYGHIGHDAKIRFSRMEECIDGSIWIEHCQAMLKIKKTDVARLKKFFANIK